MRTDDLDLQSIIEHDKNMTTILNVIDAAVYVRDITSNKILFRNQQAIDLWNSPGTQECWQALSQKKTSNQEFDKDDKSINISAKSNTSHTKKIKNTVDGRWFQCSSRTIPWYDGRVVQLEIATDITDYIKTEEKLKDAKEKAIKLAHTDDLTGTRNRRAFFKDGSQIFSLAKRYYHSTSIVMLDIDCFKKTNDIYGHIVGDKVLKEVVNTIHNNIREVDILGRIGGEEFALILPETVTSEALKTAEKLRQKISNISFDNINSRFTISSSFGVATDSSSIVPFEKLLYWADSALYCAKNKGRNRVEIYPENTMMI